MQIEQAAFGERVDMRCVRIGISIAAEVRTIVFAGEPENIGPFP